MQACRPIEFFSLKKLQPFCQKTGLGTYHFLETFLFKATSIVDSNIQKISACTTARQCQQTVQRAKCRVVWRNANKSQRVKNEQKMPDRLDEF